MQTPSKRKGVGVMEIVSYGSQGDLRPHQVGIRKSLAQTFTKETDIQSLLQETVKAAVTKALEEERENNMIYEDDVKKGFVTGITVRSLVSDWSKTSKGKEDMRKMATAVNRSYEEGMKAQNLPHNRRVFHGDILTKLKHLTKSMELDMTAQQFMDTASATIEDSTKLSGAEFLQMVSSYVKTNEQVHVTWSRKKLLHVLGLVKEDELKVDGSTPRGWIRHMVESIAHDRGGSLCEGDV